MFAVVAALLLCSYAFAGASEKRIEPAQVTLADMLPHRQFRACGLHKLSEKELRNLTAVVVQVAQEAKLEGYRLGRATSSKRNADVSNRRQDSARRARDRGATSIAVYDPSNMSDLAGGTIIANDGQTLGIVSRDRFAKDSIANQLGKHGSQFQKLSIFNQFGDYGSRFSELSAYHRTASTPPRIFKNDRFVAYVTVNKSLTPRVHPDTLKAWLRSNRAGLELPQLPELP